MRKKSMEEKAEKISSEGINKSISLFEDEYHVFHSDILKRYIFKVPSKTMLELQDKWYIGDLQMQTEVTLPTYIHARTYQKTFHMDLEKEKVYYLRFRIIGVPFHLQLNGVPIVFEDGTQLDYEVFVNPFLKNGENTILIQFNEGYEGVLFGVKILQRPKNHMLEYKIVKWEDKEKITMEIEPMYVGDFVPSWCSLLTETGKNIKKVKVTKKGKIMLDVPRKKIEIWNDETHRFYYLVFIMAEEVIAQKIAIQQEGFEENRYVVDSKPIDLRLIHFEKAIDKKTYVLRDELIKHMSLWKKRNFNAIYVEESKDMPELQKICLEFGFYYIKGTQDFSMQEEELLITSDGIQKEMPDVYLPLRAWEVEKSSGMIVIKNEMKFQNMKECYYVRIATYQNGKQVGQNIKYILDFEAGVEEQFRPAWTFKLEGDMVVKIECYQLYKTELVEKRYHYGTYEVEIHK